MVIIEPGLRSVETAFVSRKLCHDLGIKHVYVVLNGYENTDEIHAVQKLLADWPLLAAFPRIQEIRDADLQGKVPEISDCMRNLTDHIIDTLQTDIGG